ncbi:MAG: hypothetical protein M3P49_07675 [Actinomycetota bacterium]|nr:hypothetical protein [Actinomycetota bacterium]
MRRLKDFAAIRDFFSDREIEELQAAVDARREAHEAREEASPADPVARPFGSAGSERA